MWHYGKAKGNEYYLLIATVNGDCGFSPEVVYVIWRGCSCSRSTEAGSERILLVPSLCCSQPAPEETQLTDDAHATKQGLHRAHTHTHSRSLWLSHYTNEPAIYEGQRHMALLTKEYTWASLHRVYIWFFFTLETNLFHPSLYCKTWTLISSLLNNFKLSE